MTKYYLAMTGMVLAAGLMLAPVAIADNNVPPVLAAVAAAPPGGTAQTAKDFNDWRTLCTAPKGGQKQCQAFQRLTYSPDKKQQPIVVLEAILHVAAVKGKQMTLIRLVTPLGTILTPGMVLKVDDGKELKVPFTQCLPGGCVVDMAFADDMVAKLKGGQAMYVAYRMPSGKDTTFKVSLKGFGPALDALVQSAGKG